MEQPRHPFLACESPEKQRILAEGSVDGNEPVFLGVRHELNALFLLPERTTHPCAVCPSLISCLICRDIYHRACYLHGVRSPQAIPPAFV